MSNLDKIPHKKTKIVATLGPASRDPHVIRALVEKGVNVFRLNFSHGLHDEHALAIKTIREQTLKIGSSVAILADLQGPKIRTRETAGGQPVVIKRGARIIITSKPAICTDELVSIDYLHLEREIKPGQLIMINDGAIRLRAEKIDLAARSVTCIALSGGTYGPHKGVNFPNVKLRVPSLTAKDRRDLAFILAHDIQYIALSFVRSAGDVAALRRIVDRARPDMKIIAKIEKPEAAAAIGEILNVADGIMVARGDLGVEASPFEVPVLQKSLIAQANDAAKTVIVATQMLESMIEHPLPTRAEATDVANAIFDGADAIMLSGETAVGTYPAEAVDMMTRIAQTAENSPYFSRAMVDLCQDVPSSSCAVCEAAAWASHDLCGAPVCVFTRSGATALYLSKIRNQSPLFAFSPSEQVVKMLSLAWNMTAFHIPFEKHMADIIRCAERQLLAHKSVKNGDRIVIVSGTTPTRGATNFMRVKRVGEE
jgi:pyruvate kinase